MLLNIKIKKETHARGQDRQQLETALDERHQSYWRLGPKSNQR